VTAPFRPRSRRDDVIGAITTIAIEVGLVAGLFVLATVAAALVLVLFG